MVRWTLQQHKEKPATRTCPIYCSAVPVSCPLYTHPCGIYEVYCCACVRLLLPFVSVLFFVFFVIIACVFLALLSRRKVDALRLFLLPLPTPVLLPSISISNGSLGALWGQKHAFHGRTQLSPFATGHGGDHRAKGGRKDVV